MIQIDKDVPLPRARRSNILPLRDMVVGDSVLIADPTWPREKIAAYVCATAKRMGDAKFTTRKMRDGIRVWRVA